MQYPDHSVRHYAVVTSIALHALLGFSSFLLLPFVPSPRSVLAFAHSYPLTTALVAGTGTGTAGLSLVHTLKRRRQAKQSRAVIV